MLFKVELPEWGRGKATVQVSVIEKSKGEIVWCVDWVDELPARGKVKRYFLSDSARELLHRTHDERETLKQQYFISLLGEELYRDVLRAAWMRICPM